MASLFTRVLTSGCVGAFCLGAYACGTGDTTAITPITGIVVRADTLVQGFGCGTGPNEVYKYSAIVYTTGEGGAAEVFIAGGTYDCFADATFVNLCASANGSTAFNVAVAAFTKSQWDLETAAHQDLSLLSSYCSFDGGSPVTFNSTEVNLSIKDEFQSVASFKADCTATQQSNIEVLAVCPTLVPVTTAP